jgi:hypothetical protein
MLMQCRSARAPNLPRTRIHSKREAAVAVALGVMVALELATEETRYAVEAWMAQN